MVQASLASGELRALAEESLDFLQTQKYLLTLPSRYQTRAVRTLIAFLQEKELGPALAGLPQAEASGHRSP